MHTDLKIDFSCISVFFFNSPVMKMIPYTKNSTIKELIKKSIDTYMLENNDPMRINQSLESNLFVNVRILNEAPCALK